MSENVYDSLAETHEDGQWAFGTGFEDVQEKVWKVGTVKTGEKTCSRATNEGVSSMSRLPLLGVGCPE